MAGRAGGRPEILANLPGHIFPVDILGLGKDHVAVLALFVNVPGGHVRFEVALRARVWFARYLDGKGVAWVAGGTRPQAAIRIDPAHALIGPVGQIGHLDLAELGRHLFRAVYGDLSAVAGITRLPFCGFRSFERADLTVLEFLNARQGLNQGRIDGILSEIAESVRLFATGILGHLGRVTGLAVIRGDDDADLKTVVLKTVFVR